MVPHVIYVNLNGLLNESTSTPFIGMVGPISITHHLGPKMANSARSDVAGPTHVLG